MCVGKKKHLARRLIATDVLTACIQTTSLKGAQGVLWSVALSLRARRFFVPPHMIKRDIDICRPKDERDVDHTPPRGRRTRNDDENHQSFVVCSKMVEGFL